MAKNAAKKRRRGTSKVVRKPKNTFRYKKPNIQSDVVKGVWDNSLTAEANMARIGLRQNANSDVRPSAIQAAAKVTPGGRLAQGCEVARLFDVADTNDLKVVDRNYGRRRMSDEDQRYVAKLMQRFGLNYESMARDIKLNFKQLTHGKLRRMCETLLVLPVEERVVTIPDCIARESADPEVPLAMEESAESESQVLQQNGVAKGSQSEGNSTAAKKTKKRR